MEKSNKNFSTSLSKHTDEVAISLPAQALIALVRVYQKTISPDHRIFLPKKTCVFYPTCSDYAIKSISLHGALRGIARSARRVARCHPWQNPQIDLP